MARRLRPEEIPDPNGRDSRPAARAAAQAAARERLWQEQECIRKRREAIESWNRYFLSFRESADAPAARFVLQKMGFNLSDDQVGEKFFERYCYYPHTKAEKETLFINTIVHTFSGYQLKRYKKIIYRMAGIFEGSKNAITADLQKRIDRESVLKMVLEGAKDENINQVVKERLVGSFWSKKVL